MTYVPWLFSSAFAALFALCLRGFVVEQREGMRASLPRLAFAGAIFLIATAIAAVGSASLSKPEETPIATATMQDKVFAAKLRDLREESARLGKRLSAIGDDENRLRKQFDHPNSWVGSAAQLADPIPPDMRLTLTLVLLTIMLVFDIAILLLGSEQKSLLPAGWRFWERRDGREAQIATLNQMTALVWNGDYRDALSKAAEIAERSLDQFELMDFLYLRGYAAIQVYAFSSADDSADRRNAILAGAVADLEMVVDKLPKRGEALYALALAYGFKRSDADALAMFERARKRLDATKVPFAHNESVCLLRLAEEKLGVGDIEGAETCFAKVAQLGKLGSSVVQVRIKIGMIDLRTAIGKRSIGSAESALRKITGFAGLTDAQKAAIDVMAIELNARNALIKNELEAAVSEVARFVEKHMPSGLAKPDDSLVDDPFSPVLDDDLAFPRNVYTGLLFIEAVARCRIETRGRKTLTDQQVACIAEPLLLALQIQPRQRDLLGALGGLYYWTRRDLRLRAREWLEAAVAMGVASRFVRLILEHDRTVEAERLGGIDLFRSTSARFLRDPALANELRRALVEELSRFQEFEPMLVALQEKPQLESQEPTVAGLRERARHLSEVMSSVARRGQSERYARLGVLHSEYTAALSSLEVAAQALEALERRVVGDLGDVLVLD